MRASFVIFSTPPRDFGRNLEAHAADAIRANANTHDRNSKKRERLFRLSNVD